MHHDQAGFMPGRQGWFDISRPTNIAQQINGRKDKSHTVISIGAQNTFDKNPTPFHDENTYQTKNRKELPQTDKRHL